MRYKMPKCSSSCEKCVLERLIACLEHCHTQQTTSIPLKGLSQLLRTDSAIQTTAHAPQLPPSANSCTCANCHPPQPRCNVQVIEISSCGSIICENAKNAPGRYGPSIARFLLVSRWRSCGLLEFYSTVYWTELQRFLDSPGLFAKGVVVKRADSHVRGVKWGKEALEGWSRRLKNPRESWQYVRLFYKKNNLSH